MRPKGLAGSSPVLSAHFLRFQSLLPAENLKVLPEECIVIEDSKNGVLAGKNVNMYVIGVRAGNKNPQDISKADEIVDTLSDITFCI